VRGRNDGWNNDGVRGNNDVVRGRVDG